MLMHTDARGRGSLRRAEQIVAVEVDATLVPSMSRSIDVLAHIPTYEEFRVCIHSHSYKATYLVPNVPVVLPASMTETWPARARYEAGGRVHWEALSEDYGEHIVPVIIGGEERKEMKLKDALSLIDSETRPIYIKDWHLVRSATNASQPLSQRLPYMTPPLFSDDCMWYFLMPGMNNVTPPVTSSSFSYNPDAWVSTASKPLEPDDFRFCYAGTAGSFTPLHRDGMSLLVC